MKKWMLFSAITVSFYIVLLTGCAVSESPSQEPPKSSPVSSAVTSPTEPTPTCTSSDLSSSCSDSNSYTDLPMDAPESTDDIPYSEEEREKWERQAYTLTSQIVDYCLQTFDEATGIDALNSEEILNFVWTTSQYNKDSDYPYKDGVTVTLATTTCPYISAHVSEHAAQEIADKLFGSPDWSCQESEYYNKSIPEYSFNLEEKLPESPYSCQDANAEVKNGSVIVTFHLVGTQTVVDATGKHLKDFGMYQAFYSIESESEESYLQFVGMYPVE